MKNRKSRQTIESGYDRWKMEWDFRERDFDGKGAVGGYWLQNQRRK